MSKSIDACERAQCSYRDTPRSGGQWDPAGGHQGACEQPHCWIGKLLVHWHDRPANIARQLASKGCACKTGLARPWKVE